jgi:uncharacterized protein (DUF1684 family)
MRAAKKASHVWNFLLLAGLLATSCSRPPTEEPSRPLDPISQARRDRDLAFKNDQDSPLRDEDKARFRGLEYYAVDASYRFRVTLKRHPNPETVKMVTNTGEQRLALRYGWFEFRIGGQDLRLQVYRIVDASGGSEARLFIPFRDATSGKETYGAGRYIDLDENTSGIYDLDFNRAYNPSCAYGKAYSCPIPPAENSLPVPIRAGERTFPLH